MIAEQRPAVLEINPVLEEQGWRLCTSLCDVGILHRRNGFARRLLITFDAMAEFHHRRRRVGGDTLAVACEADHLHISAGGENWFQTEEIFSVLDQARVLRDQYDEAILYGHSMGGYGALIFSKALAATSVVAFSPQFSIDPLKAPFEFRFVGQAERVRFVFDDMLANMASDAPKYIVYDPHFALDRRHFGLMWNAPGVHGIPIPFAGHYPGMMLNECGILRNFLVGLILGTVGIPALRSMIRHNRRKSHRYLVECAQSMSRRGRFATSLRLANAAYVLAPENPSVLETYSALLTSDSNHYGLAHCLLRLIMKEQPEWRQYDSTLANLWTEIRRNAEPIVGKAMVAAD